MSRLQRTFSYCRIMHEFSMRIDKIWAMTYLLWFVSFLCTFVVIFSFSLLFNVLIRHFYFCLCLNKSICFEERRFTVSNNETSTPILFIVTARFAQKVYKQQWKQFIISNAMFFFLQRFSMENNNIILLNNAKTKKKKTNKKNAKFILFLNAKRRRAKQ